MPDFCETYIKKIDFPARTLEDFVREIFIAWKRIRRWQGKEGVTYENDLEHSFKTALQTMLFLEVEGRRSDIDPFELLVLAALHDIGEGCTGVDIIYTIKNDPRMKGALAKLEEKDFDAKFSELPLEARAALLNIYHLQDSRATPAGKFFAIVEQMGYAFFSHEEINRRDLSPATVLSFTRVLERVRKDIKPQPDFFGKLRDFCAPLDDPEMKKVAEFSPEPVLRRIIGWWKSIKAWPEFASEEDLLERVMKNALIGCIMLVIERQKQPELDAYKVLSALLVRNLSKVSYPIWPWRMKHDPDFPEAGDEELEREHFTAASRDFPEEMRKLLADCFDLRRGGGSAEAEIYRAIKLFGYGLFALYEFERGHREYAEVLCNVTRAIDPLSDKFFSLGLFYKPLRNRFICGAEYWKESHQPA
ncbi:MAG: YfbR-like 5'-deoxynucleotidase [Patescibacteria group bacterium]